MSLRSVEDSLIEISKELGNIEEKREMILKESRDVITYSAKAIIDLHTGRIKEAKNRLKSASELLIKLRMVASDELYRYLVQPETEFVEASTFHAVTVGRKIPSYKELGVRGASYLLGLMDAVGEIKRKIYDTIRKDKIEEAVSLFTLMEHIYTNIYPYAIYDHIAPGLRRKLDVARILIEDTRSTITEEVRRIKFIGAIEEFSKKLPQSNSRESFGKI